MTPADLFATHRELAHYWARRVGRTLPRGRLLSGELFTAALLGLWRATQRYEPARGVKFETYAALPIRGAILDWLRDADRLSHSRRASGRAPAQLSLDQPQPPAAACREDPRDPSAYHALGSRLTDPRALAPDRRSCLADLLLQARAGLSWRDRLLLVLYYREGLTMAEIAAALGYHQTNISRRHKALLRAMREALLARGHTPEECLR